MVASSDHLPEADVVVAEADVGEPHRTEAVVAVAVTGVVGQHLDGQLPERAPVEVDDLTGLGVGLGTEVDVERVAAVEVQLHPGDEAVLDAAPGLEEGDLVGGPGLVVGELEAVAGGGKKAPTTQEEERSPSTALAARLSGVNVMGLP